MSDPLTNLEIQDVLSSIRRLVSEDSRHKAKQDKGQDESKAAESSKLVLTEALRVPEADGAEDDAATDDAAMGEDTLREAVAGDGMFEEGAPVPALGEDDETAEAGLLREWDEDSETEAADSQSLEDTIAELEAAVAGIGGEFEPDGSEVAKGAGADSALEDAFEDGFAVDEAADDEGIDLAQPVTSGEMDGGVAGTAAASLDAGDAGLEEVVETDDMPDETLAADLDGIGEDAGALVEDEMTEEAGLVPDEDDELEASGPETAADDQEIEDAPDGDGEPTMVEEGDKIPAFVHSGGLRAAYEAANATGEPPASTGRIRRLTLTAADAVTEEAAPWDRDDMPKADLLEAVDADVDAAGEGGDDDDGAALFGAGDEAVIDMEMLRDLVAEIIREELQGPLGERITRNVRMLVRREINRALESRGLD